MKYFNSIQTKDVKNYYSRRKEKETFVIAIILLLYTVETGDYGHIMIIITHQLVCNKFALFCTTICSVLFA